MAKPPLTEKLVYLALKDVFRVDKIQPSTIEEIRKIIEKHKDESKIRALIQNHGVESVSKVAQDLLKYQVFVSMAKAEVRFPEVFEVRPTEAEQPNTSEANIATSSAAAVRSAGTHNSEEFLGTGDRIKTRKGKERARASSQTHSPGSISLPLWDQHRVLVIVQSSLEKACFTFAQKHLESVLQREGWDCAEAVELNWWSKVLLTHHEECNLNSLQGADEILPSLLDAIAQLRHDTVHRVRLSSNELSQYLTDAVMLAQLLQDDMCSKFMSNIRQRTQDAIDELVRNKAILDCRLAEIKSDFVAKRAELDRQEAALLETAVREHVKPTISVSGSLDSLYNKLDRTDAIQAPWRHGRNPALPNDQSPGSKGIVETHVITSVTEPAAEPAVTHVPDAADEDNEKVEEAKKPIEEKKKTKKKKKAAKEQAKQQEEAKKKAAEEEEDNAEPELGGGLRDDAVEHVQEDVEIVQQQFVPPTFVPRVDSGSIGQALTGEKKDAEEDKTKDRSEEEQFFECSEIMVDGRESDPEYPSKDPPLEQQAMVTDSTNLTGEGRTKSEIATASGLADSELLGYGNRSLHERSTSPAPTCVGQTQNNADQGHTKSCVEEDTPTENSIMDPGSRSEQPAATKDQSVPLTVIHSYQEESWPASVCIKPLDNDPRLKLLTAANRKGGMTLVSM